MVTIISKELMNSIRSQYNQWQLMLKLSYSRSSHMLYNIPLHLTPFIGRESEVTEIAKRLNDPHCRLLTLVGLGGVGKTRLAIESISQLNSSQFEHGIYYVPLAPLKSADQIVTTIINVLGIHIGGAGTPKEELVKFLKGRKLLLVMDNYEHVLDGVDVVIDILNNASDVKFLTTSRKVLNLHTENIWHVKGMPYPKESQVTNFDSYSALKLFIQCAERIRHDFSSHEVMDCIVHICQLVDGMPLAIELAASWIRSLSCMDIVRQIGYGLDILSTRAHDISERHRSIRAVFDHSWSLLTENEQAVFARLSVFRGGFTSEAAEAVAGASLTTLSDLVEKSMIRLGINERYDVHELLRQYGEHRFNDLNLDEDLLLQHMVYFADFMRAQAPAIKGKSQVESVNKIDADLDNILSAWQVAIRHEKYEILDKMMETLILFCDLRAYLQLGVNLCQMALDGMSSFSDDDTYSVVYNRLRARYIHAWLLQQIYPIPDHIRIMINETLALAEEQQDSVIIMHCYWLKGELGRLDRWYGKEELNVILEFYDKAVNLARELRIPYYEGRVLQSIAVVYVLYLPKAFSETAQIVSKTERLVRQLSDVQGLARLLTAKYQMRPADSEHYLHESLSLYQTLNNGKSIGIIKCNLGWHYFQKGDFKSSEQYFIQAEQIVIQVNFLSLLQLIYSGLSRLHSIQGNYTEGERFAQLTSIYSDTEFHLDMTYFYICLSQYENALRHLESGLRSTLDYYYYHTILVAFMLNQNYEKVRAAELLGLAFNHRQSITGWMETWEQLAQLQHNLRVELGDDVYDAAWERGKRLHPNDTITQWLASLNKTTLIRLIKQPLIDPLTQRELEILRLIGNELTNPAIAETLTIAITTVRTHVRNILRKLGVSNRYEAVDRARELGLL